MGVASWCESLTKNTVTIRLATNAVLMISDLDVVFSGLFMKELLSMGGINIYFFGVVVVGICTYLAGVLWFGPQQKYHAMTECMNMMESQPQLFEIELKKGSATEAPVTKRLNRTDPYMHPNGKDARNIQSFQDIASVFEDRNLTAFRSGMTSYGKSHVWTAVNAQNARNCCDMVHGTPFLRLARFGFFAEPSPQDLGCILNANALYTFTTGIPQIAFGVMIITTQDLTINVLLPLGVSSASFFLSLVNIFCNFAAILSELNDESIMSDEIQQTANADQKTKQDALERANNVKNHKDKADYDRKCEEAERAYQNVVETCTRGRDVARSKSPPDEKAVSDFNMKEDEAREKKKQAQFIAKEQWDTDRSLQTAQYLEESRDIHRYVNSRLREEMREHRYKVEETKKIRRGQIGNPDKPMEQKMTDAMLQQRMQQKTTLMNQKKKILEQFSHEVSKLDPTVMKHEDLRTKVDELATQRDSAMKVFDEQLALLEQDGEP